jgi:hypothetical protein
LNETFESAVIAFTKIDKTDFDITDKFVHEPVAGRRGRSNDDSTGQRIQAATVVKIT